MLFAQNGYSFLYYWKLSKEQELVLRPRNILFCFLIWRLFRHILFLEFFKITQLIIQNQALLGLLQSALILVLIFLLKSIAFCLLQTFVPLKLLMCKAMLFLSLSLAGILGWQWHTVHTSTTYSINHSQILLSSAGYSQEALHGIREVMVLFSISLDRSIQKREKD